MTPGELGWLEMAKSRTKRALPTAVELRCSGERDSHLVATVHPVPLIGSAQHVAVWLRPGSMSKTFASYTDTKGKARSNFVRTGDEVAFAEFDSLTPGPG